MIRRDYLLRMIEQLGAMLRRIRQQSAAHEFTGAETELDQAFVELIGSGAEAVEKLGETELLAKLTLDGPTQVVRDKAHLLVALLQEAGLIHEAQGRQEAAHQSWLKALNLLLTLKLQDVDGEFPEFVPKIDLLRDELAEAELPLPTLAALWRHYEATGEFARAEDALADLLEAQPDNEALRFEAKAFYERLLGQSDSALEEGNLPRAEVKTGLAALSGHQ